MRTSSKRLREKSTPRSDQVLKLTDYHISRHVVSTFKRLTTTTTHTAALSIFTKQTGYHKYNNPSRKPYIAVCSKHSTPMSSRNPRRGGPSGLATPLFSLSSLEPKSLGMFILTIILVQVLCVSSIAKTLY